MSEDQRLQQVWYAMWHRCYNPNCESFAQYGARGIRMTDAWLDYPTFRDWALQNGYDSVLTIERINNAGDYEPANCKWATRTEQNRNRSIVTMTHELAQQMRTEFASMTGKYSTKVKALASRYPCSVATVYAILAGKNWSQN